jgi:hypothetical protein
MNIIESDKSFFTDGFYFVAFVNVKFEREMFYEDEKQTYAYTKIKFLHECTINDFDDNTIICRYYSIHDYKYYLRPNCCMLYDDRFIENLSFYNSVVLHCGKINDQMLNNMLNNELNDIVKCIYIYLLSKKINIHDFINHDEYNKICMNAIIIDPFILQYIDQTRELCSHAINYNKNVLIHVKDLIHIVDNYDDNYNNNYDDDKSIKMYIKYAKKCDNIHDKLSLLLFSLLVNNDVIVTEDIVDYISYSHKQKNCDHLNKYYVSNEKIINIFTTLEKMKLLKKIPFVINYIHDVDDEMLCIVINHMITKNIFNESTFMRDNIGERINNMVTYGFDDNLYFITNYVAHGNSITEDDTVAEKKSKIFKYNNNDNCNEMIIKVVKHFGLFLERFPINLQSEDICLEAVKQNGNALQYVKEQTYDIQQYY